MSDKKSNDYTIKPAYLAAAAVVGIGVAIYSVFFSSSEEPHKEEPKPPSRCEQYDTHPNQLKSGKEEENNCTICMQALKVNVKTLECSHSFHSTCVDKWFNTKDGSNQLNKDCPICRKLVK